MEPIPNWYRWLLIVIATLIMCACRSPLQDNGQPLIPRIATGSMAIASVAAPGAKPATTSRRNQRAQGTDSIAALSASLNASAREGAARATELAPVIRKNQQGSLQLQKIESILVGPTNAELPNSVETQARSKVAVVHADDAAVEVVQATNVQSDSEVEEFGSPFADDPVAPLPNDPPLAPLIDRDAPGQSPTLEYGSADSVLSEVPVVGRQIVVGEQMIGEQMIGEQMIGERMVGDGPMFGSEQIIVQRESESVTEFCPSDCPVQATPDCWEPRPGESMNLAPKDLAQRYPDEYICDGGDALGSVRVRPDWSLQGLDPEDTVGHYDKLDGGLVVEPSNRVCIYAPRFAAVRKITGALEEEKYLQLQLAERDILAVTDQAQQVADQVHQNLAVQRNLALQPASSFKSRQLGAESSQAQALHSLDKDLSAHENLRVMKYGVHKQSEKPRLAEFTAKAIAWSHDKAVQVVLDEVLAQTRVTRQGTDEIFSIADRGPAKFRVIKTASVSDALPGEEVEFTLRFDNIGYQPIGNVTIVDNLTTRLEYIADSQLCSLDAEFENDENQVDSLTLRWELRDPIAPGKGGLIRFRCRVR